jgi:hypothetical protein
MKPSEKSRRANSIKRPGNTCFLRNENPLPRITPSEEAIARGIARRKMDLVQDAMALGEELLEVWE